MVAKGRMSRVGSTLGKASRALQKGVVKGGKAAVERGPEIESFSRWLIRIVASLPKYLQFYLCKRPVNPVSRRRDVGGLSHGRGLRACAGAQPGGGQEFVESAGWVAHDPVVDVV